MVSFTQLYLTSGLAALASAHGVIVGAQGIDGSPLSVGFLVNPELARNCTTISPCQQDATLIRDAEIEQNIVNECGRTELAGNIDIGENTENALVANAVTQVQRGSTIEVTIHQVNADGAGPYFCDLDTTSNGRRLVGQIPLTVTNNVPGINGFSQAKAQEFKMTVQLPDDFQCIGASTGNICTVRCRNNALAGPFGGCFPVQQIDVEPQVNRPENIESFQEIGATLAQVASNQADLPKAIQANANAGSDEALQNAAAVEAILNNAPVTSQFPQQTPDLVAPDAGADATASAPAPIFETNVPQQGGRGGRGRGGNRAGNNGNQQEANEKRALRWGRRMA